MINGETSRRLFPSLEECYINPLADMEKQLVKVLEIVKVARHVPKSVEKLLSTTLQEHR